MASPFNIVYPYVVNDKIIARGDRSKRDRPRNNYGI